MVDPCRFPDTELEQQSPYALLSLTDGIGQTVAATNQGTEPFFLLGRDGNGTEHARSGIFGQFATVQSVGLGRSRYRSGNPAGGRYNYGNPSYNFV